MRDTRRPCDVAGDLQSCLTLFAFGLAGFLEPMRDRTPASIIGDVGSHFANVAGLLIWPAVNEVALIKRPRRAGWKVGKYSVPCDCGAMLGG